MGWFNKCNNIENIKIGDYVVYSFYIEHLAMAHTIVVKVEHINENTFSGICRRSIGKDANKPWQCFNCNFLHAMKIDMDYMIKNHYDDFIFFTKMDIQNKLLYS